jgi:hypothetical protein
MDVMRNVQKEGIGAVEKAKDTDTELDSDVAD